MPQYLVSGYLPDNFDPSTQDEATIEAIHALNREMIAAGVRKFAGGLGKAHTLRAQPNGELLLTDGPLREQELLRERLKRWIRRLRQVRCGAGLCNYALMERPGCVLFRKKLTTGDTEDHRGKNDCCECLQLCSSLCPQDFGGVRAQRAQDGGQGGN